MLARPRTWTWLLPLLCAVLLVPSCRYLYPEPEPEVRQDDKDGPLFDDDPAFYAKNAKEYFEGGQYGKARDQWETQLKIQPDEPWARMGVAYCDYFLGREATVRGDLEFAHERLTLAEQSFRDLWDGSIPGDTSFEDPSEALAWRSALGLAMTLRGLGSVNGLATELQKQRLAAIGGRNPAQQKETEDAVTRLQGYRTTNYRAAVDLFERLAAMENASPEAIKHLADLYLVLKQDDDAERQYRRFLALGRETWEARAQLKDEVDEQFTNIVAAKEATRFIDEKLQNNVRRRVEVMVNLAGLHWSNERYPEALDYLSEALEISPDRIDLLVKMAQCEGEMGLYPSAIDHLDTFIRQSGERDEDWTDNLGLAYRMRREFELQAKKRAKPR